MSLPGLRTILICYEIFHSRKIKSPLEMYYFCIIISQPSVILGKIFQTYSYWIDRSLIIFLFLILFRTLDWKY